MTEECEEPPCLVVATAALYGAFSGYRKPSLLEGCPCCVSVEHSELLVAYPLRELLQVDLDSYYRKAITTWGTDGDYKYFLPRLLELARGGQSWDLEVLFAKLNYAEWWSWPESEQDAVLGYLTSWWWDAEEGGQCSGGLAASVLPELAAFFSDITPLLRAWELPLNPPRNGQLLRRRALSLAEVLELGRWRRPDEASLLLEGPASRTFLAWLLSTGPLDLLSWASTQAPWTEEEKSLVEWAGATLRRWRGR